jgi:hypothetical protein
MLAKVRNAETYALGAVEELTFCLFCFIRQIAQDGREAVPRVEQTPWADDWGGHSCKAKQEESLIDRTARKFMHVQTVYFHNKNQLDG